MCRNYMENQSNFVSECSGFCKLCKKNAVLHGVQNDF